MGLFLAAEIAEGNKSQEVQIFLDICKMPSLSMLALNRDILK
jgi:hypothetical protein